MPPCPQRHLPECNHLRHAGVPALPSSTSSKCCLSVWNIPLAIFLPSLMSIRLLKSYSREAGIRSPRAGIKVAFLGLLERVVCSHSFMPQDHRLPARAHGRFPRGGDLWHSGTLEFYLPSCHPDRDLIPGEVAVPMCGGGSKLLN